MRYTLSKYDSDRDVIHFYCFDVNIEFDVSDDDEVVVTKYVDSDLVFELRQAKEHARSFWRLLVETGYTRSQVYAN